jgi:tetratricopeptide (TPR) repeat protein
VGTAVFLAAVLLPGSASGNPRSAELRRLGYELAYNLDHDEALAMFRRAVEADPADSASYRALAALAWLNLLYARGALTSDEYLSSLPESNAAIKAPPADMAAMFHTNVDKAIRLAEADVQRRPNDVDAHYALGAAVGLQAAYTVSIEGSLFGAVGLARRAFNEQERVLELDPSRKDAAFFVGSYRYAVANLASFVRLMAYLAGFGGGRERAIQMLEESVAYPSDVQADAMVLLVLVYNKERRYDDAMRLLGGLMRRFPRNRLLWLESGATEMRAGRPVRAVAYLDTGIALFERDGRKKAFGEASLWYFKRGAARAATGDRAGAEADLRKALAAEGRDWTHGRCHLELGKLADLSGNRTAAVAEYRLAAALCGGDRDPVGRAEAERFIERPFKGTNAAPPRQ